MWFAFIFTQHLSYFKYNFGKKQSSSYSLHFSALLLIQDQYNAAFLYGDGYTIWKVWLNAVIKQAFQICW